eukprot:6409986-Amphidinium_carterae.1
MTTHIGTVTTTNFLACTEHKQSERQPPQVQIIRYNMNALEMLVFSTPPRGQKVFYTTNWKQSNAQGSKNEAGRKLLRTMRKTREHHWKAMNRG